MRICYMLSRAKNGFLYTESCSLEVLIEDDVLASGLVDAVLEGRHYNRGLGVHKLVSEAPD